LAEDGAAKGAYRVSQSAWFETEAALERMVAERTAGLREMLRELEQVTHAIVCDMRSPLRAIQCFAGLIESRPDEISAEIRNDYLRRILSASHRLNQLIGDVLTYQNITEHVLPLQTVDLSKLLRDLLNREPAFRTEQADIRIEGKLPIVLGNESLLLSCFAHLLTNAVKFTTPGAWPKIRVWAQGTNGTTRIWIQDNGIGIPKYAQQRIFSIFQKLDEHCEGVGIGLALVRKAVERMDGKVGVESEPGKGSRFWVELNLPTQRAKSARSGNNASTSDRAAETCK
jgi:signal transduction histidine kinase